MSTLHPAGFLTQAVPSPFAGQEAVSEERARRKFRPADILNADAELHVEDADMFPVWEPNGDELTEMVRQAQASFAEPVAVPRQIGGGVSRTGSGWKAHVTVNGSIVWSKTFRGKRADAVASNAMEAKRLELLRRPA